MQTPEQPRRGNARTAYLVAAALVLLVLLLGITRCSYMDRPAQRTDVASAVASLSPSCRPIAEMRIRNALISGGRPLNRRQVTQFTSHLKGCEDIDAQLQGVADGMASQ